MADSKRGRVVQGLKAGMVAAGAVFVGLLLTTCVAFVPTVATFVWFSPDDPPAWAVIPSIFLGGSLLVGLCVGFVNYREGGF